MFVRYFFTSITVIDVLNYKDWAKLKKCGTYMYASRGHQANRAQTT